MQVGVFPSDGDMTVGARVPIAGGALHQTSCLLQDCNAHDKLVVLDEILELSDRVLRDGVDPSLNELGLISLLSDGALNDLGAHITHIILHLLEVNSHLCHIQAEVNRYSTQHELV